MWKHVKHLNAVVRWLKRQSCFLVTEKVPFPWQVTAFPDSAFRAQERDCLATRAAVILITNVDFFQSKESARVQEHVFKLSALGDGVMHSLVIQGMVNELLHGPWMADQLQNLREFRNLSINLQVTTGSKGLHSAIAADKLKSPTELRLIYLSGTTKDRLTSGTVQRLRWIDTRDMISDVLAKGGLSRKPILEL